MIRVRINNVRHETPSVNTLTFTWDHAVQPGQFAMLWMPGYGEIPMSFSSTGKEKAFTVKNYGLTSSKVLELVDGDYIYFRGPYGRGYTERKGRSLIIGGGSGMASLRPLINDDSYGIVSAKTRSELLFRHMFHEASLMVATDDGSEGIKGFPVDILKDMDISPFKNIYICGPEMMIFSIVKYLADKRPEAEASLERSMKCGIGVCDSCSVSGFQLCRDGPVFSVGEIANMKEYGHEKLSFSGKRVPVT